MNKKMITISKNELLFKMQANRMNIVQYLKNKKQSDKWRRILQWNFFKPKARTFRDISEEIFVLPDQFVLTDEHEGLRHLMSDILKLYRSKLGLSIVPVNDVI